MSTQDKSPYDDQLLTRYLLGGLPAEETERLDGLSVADDEVAARLSAVENDLVDAYVRGEVRGESRKQFESFYLTSARRREKVRLAQALLERESRTATAPSGVARTAAAAATKRDEALTPEHRLPFQRFVLQWGFAGAAAVLLLASGYLLLTNLRMQNEMNDAQARQSELDRNERELRSQLDQQRSANAQAQKELERLRASQTNLDQLTTVSLLLPPPTRGVSGIPSITVSRGTDLVVLLLTLESNDFPAYRAALKDPATNQILWRSANLAPAPAADKKAVAISFRAGLLKQQNYIVELTGLSAGGAPELIGGYPFRAVLK